MQPDVLECHVRDNIKLASFDLMTGRILLMDLDTGKVHGYPITGEIAFSMGLRMLIFAKSQAKERIAELHDETLTLSETINDMRDHIQRLEYPYETKEGDE